MSRMVRSWMLFCASEIDHTDPMVFRTCCKHGSPVAAVPAGGRAANNSETIEMHINTCLTLGDVFGCVEEVH